MARIAAAVVVASALLLGCVARAGAATPRLVPVGTFNAPIYVTAPPGDVNRVFVVEREGRIRVLDRGVRHTFLDIDSLVQCCDGERGMTSMAFAPDYATSGLFYVFYTARSPVGRLTVVEYRRSAANPDAADPSSARVLLRIPHDQQDNHNGGQLQFGPDGMLYIGTGDGGSGGDPAGNGQNLTSRTPAVVSSVNHDPLLAKILRIDPRHGTPYAIPAGNPFAAPAREVFAYGLRNPWRFSFDRSTGDLVVGDVGQDSFEEVDFAAAPGLGAGADYGWNRYEGLHTYPGGAPAGPPFPSGFTFPVLEKSHGGDGYCAIIGGYVVRDPRLAELYGQYVYSDLCNPALRAARLTPAGASADHALGLSVSNLASFGEDGCGRLYAVSLDGPVYRLATAGGCAGPSIPFGGGPAPPGPGPGPGTNSQAAPAIAIHGAHVREGDRGRRRMRFTVTLSRAATQPVTVRYRTARRSARAPRDYSARRGTLRFAPGQLRRRLTVRVRGDRLPERDETFAVVLSHPSANATLARRRARGTIRDDDPAVGAIRSRRTAPLAALVCDPACAGVRFAARAFVRGRAVWRFSASSGAGAEPHRLATIRRRVRRAGASAVLLRLHRHRRLLRTMAARHPVSLRATLRFTARTGKRQTRARTVVLSGR